MTEEAQGGNLLTEEPPVKTEAWYPEEYKELITRTGWKEPSDALKSYRELEKSASSKIKLPTPESSAEEVSAFYAKIRGVDTPDGYEVKVPENVPIDGDMINKLRQWAFEAGAPKTAFETVLRNYLEEMSNESKISLEAAKQELHEEWKDEYDVNFKMADRFTTNECREDFRSFLIESGLNNHPIVVRQMLDFAKKIATDKLVRGEGGGGGDKDEYVPQYKDSPEMYRNGDDEDSRKARAYFEARGFKY